MARRGTRISSGYKAPAGPSLGLAPGQTHPQAQAQAQQAQPLPIDPNYQNALSANQQTLANTLAQIGYNRGQLNTQYGFTPTFDPQGNITGETIDPSNPFSRAALLEQTFKQNKAGYGQNLASRGQLYASSYQNAQDYAGTQYAQGYNATKSAYEQAQQGLTQQEAAARAGLATGNANAYGTYVQNALNAKQPLPADPGDPSATPAASGSYGSTSRTVKVKAPKVRGRVGVKVSSGYKPGIVKVSSGYKA